MQNFSTFIIKSPTTTSNIKRFLTWLTVHKKKVMPQTKKKYSTLFVNEIAIVYFVFFVVVSFDIYICCLSCCVCKNIYKKWTNINTVKVQLQLFFLLCANCFVLFSTFSLSFFLCWMITNEISNGSKKSKFHLPKP